MLWSPRGRFGILVLLLLIPLSFALDGVSAAPRHQAGIDPANFVPVVDNRYFPLQPGTTYIYEGTNEGHRERAVLTVRTDTRVILGVRCVVVEDVITEDGQPLEQTVDWYAQDKAGNVWYFGEDTKEFENGVVVSTQGTWLAGSQGAQAGIIMEAQPQLGDQYPQEQAVGVAEDMARIIELHQSVTVRYGRFADVLVTEETTPLEPGYVEQKYYAPGIGNVRALDVKGGLVKMQLVDIVRSPVGMPRTGATDTPEYLWALISVLGVALSVAAGLILRRTPAPA